MQGSVVPRPAASTTVPLSQKRQFKSLPVTQQLEGTEYDRLWNAISWIPTFSKLQGNRKKSQQSKCIFCKSWREVCDIPFLKKQNKINQLGELMLQKFWKQQGAPVGTGGQGERPRHRSPHQNLCSEAGRQRGQASPRGAPFPVASGLSLVSSVRLPRGLSPRSRVRG